MAIAYVTERDNCCGCKVCGDVCEKAAIRFDIDREGFWFPTIDEEKCVSCIKCRKLCPNIQIVKNEASREPKVFAAWIKDKNMRMESTSGGMYYPAARAVIEQGGVVVACRYTEDWKHAEHIVAETMDEMFPTIRSKYFQSDTEGIYRKTKTLLEEGRLVLYCGCPCQCAALRSYLRKDYGNLYTIDFICRGINSPKAFSAFVSEQEKKQGAPVISVHCKNKRKGWTSLGVLMRFANGNEYFETRKESYWSLGYIRDNLYMRGACHRCHYRTIPRISDITIGDFWGIQDMDPEDMRCGISVLMLNTNKGERLLEMYRNEIVLQEKNVEDVYRGNPCLYDSPKEGKNRERFFSLLDTMSFSEAVQACCGKLGC